MDAVFHPYATRTYRRDIQGIRAIGALMIMVYHLWLNKVSGGVDVFFVVSGFFMGNMLLAQLASGSKVQPFLFWGKIINRVAPSAYVVLIVTLFFAFIFVPETQWHDLSDHVLASVLHLENIHLMRTSVDYLARQEPPSAVQQFWALSIQIQFYFLLPVAFIFAAKLSRMAHSVYPMFAVLATIALLSFAYSVYKTSTTPDSAYFNPVARLWEFFAGVLLAVVLPYLKLNRRSSEVLAGVGLAALLFGGLLIPKTISFPGFIALVPVGAAVFLIVSGANQSTTGVGRLLSQKMFGFFGQIAFTIYLWHWPLLVFYVQSTGAQTVSAAAGVMIICAAVALATLTNLLIENRFLKTNNKSTWRFYLVGAAFFLPAVAIAGATKLHFKAIVDSQHGMQREFFAGEALQLQNHASGIPYQQFIAAKSDQPRSYKDSCHQRTAQPEVIACDYGAVDATRAIALVGGSHATQWLPALDTIGRQLGLRVVNISKSYCPLGALEGAHPSCHEWNKRVVNYLQDMQPLAVITNSTRAAKDGAPEYVPEAYTRQWQALTQAGIPVVGIRDNPQFDFDVVHCVVRNKDNPLACAKPRAQALQDPDPAAELAAPMPGVELVDMTPYFCTESTCSTVFNDILMYRDREHISVAYADYLTARLHAQLARVAPGTFAGDGPAVGHNE